MGKQEGTFLRPGLLMGHNVSLCNQGMMMQFMCPGSAEVTVKPVPATSEQEIVRSLEAADVSHIVLEIYQVWHSAVLQMLHMLNFS